MWADAHAGQFWLGDLAHRTADLAAALGHFTAARDALAAGGPSPLLIDVLTGRADVLLNHDRVPEAAKEARRALVMAPPTPRSPSGCTSASAPT